MEVICLEEPAFYNLLEKVYQRLKDESNVKEDKWISTEEAMKMLRITSKSTLQKYRDEGRIRFSQINQRVILYDVDSLKEFLNRRSHDTF